MRVRYILLMAGVIVVLALYLFFANRPKAAPAPESPVYVWSSNESGLVRVVIRLPLAGKAEAWREHQDQFWYFDRPNGPKVSSKRWGGGVPLLMRGPRADRLVCEKATDEQLGIFGLVNPRMTIDLTLESGRTIAVEVGDDTPDG